MAAMRRGLGHPPLERTSSKTSTNQQGRAGRVVILHMLLRRPCCSYEELPLASPFQLARWSGRPRARTKTGEFECQKAGATGDAECVGRVRTTWSRRSAGSPRPLRFSQCLLHRADFEDFRTADRAGPLSRRTSILHRDLFGVLDLALSLALHAVTGGCSSCHDHSPSKMVIFPR
jgi:hypothetical protein